VNSDLVCTTTVKTSLYTLLFIDLE